MLLLAPLALAAEPPATPVVRQARATVHIVSAARASRDEWKRLPPQKRREVLRRDEHGRVTLLRLIENE